MSRRRQLRSAATCADVDDLLDILRDNLGKADAFITSAEELIEQPRSVDGDDASDDDLRRRRIHIEHLVEATKLAVRAAAYTIGASTLARNDPGVLVRSGPDRQVRSSG